MQFGHFFQQREDAVIAQGADGQPVARTLPPPLLGLTEL